MSQAARRDHEQERGQDVPSDSETHSPSTGTEADVSATHSNPNRGTGSQKPLPPSPAPHESDSFTPMTASRPPAIRMAPGTGSTSSTGGNGNGNNTNVGHGTMLPPPHALPENTQPIILQLNSESIPPVPGLPPPTLPPLPAHPALALMRSNTSASAPRRPLSAPRIPSTRTVPTSTGYGNGAHRASSATTNSIGKDRVLLETDGNTDALPPTSPSGRVLQVDLPVLGVGVGRYRERERDRGAQYRYGGSAAGMRASFPEPIYGPGYDRREGREPERTMDADMDMVDKGRHGAGAYMDVVSEIGVPRLPRTVKDRLKSTMETTDKEINKYTQIARMTGYALNTAIGLQVFLSALITALSAVTSGRRTQIMTSILGGAGTIVASYLARARGSNEPELSITRVKDLQRFQRACEAFEQDCGEETGFEGFPRDSTSNENGDGNEKMDRYQWDGGVRARELDERIRRLRGELEHLLGNGNGERRLSPLV